MIGFNTTAGVQIVGTSSTDATNALVEGNSIGTDASGTQHLGNATAVQIFNAAGNTIGGTTAGASTSAANVIGFNTNAGIAILSGIGNAVNGNIYDGTNGTLQTPSVAANDIGVGVGANGNLPPPLLLSASLSSDGHTLALALASNVSTSTLLDVYLYGAGQRAFLHETTIAAGSFFASLPVTGVTAGSQIVVTQTVAADGTSPFSDPLSVAPRLTVTNTNSSGPGSLSDAVAGAELAGVPASARDITFQIPGPGPHTIGLALTLSISVPVTIDGTSELTNQGRPASCSAMAGVRPTAWTWPRARTAARSKGSSSAGSPGPRSSRRPRATRSAAPRRRGERREHVRFRGRLDHGREQRRRGELHRHRRRRRHWAMLRA